MFDRLTGRQARATGTTPRLSRSHIWIVLGVVAFVVVMGFQLMGGGGGGSSTSAAPQDGESSEFLADGYAALDDDTETDSSSMWGVWGGILIPLAIVIACIYGGLKGLKYVNSRVTRVTSQAKVLESLDVLPLSQTNAIHLVRVGPRVLAVGASGQQLSVLTELEGEQADEIVSACRAREQAPSPAGSVLEPFRDIVQKRMHRQTPPVEESPTVEPRAAVYAPSPPVASAAPQPVTQPTTTGLPRPAGTPVMPVSVAHAAVDGLPVIEPDVSAVERLEAVLSQIHPESQPEFAADPGRHEMRAAVLKAQAEWPAGDPLAPPAARAKRAPRERPANA